MRKWYQTCAMKESVAILGLDRPAQEHPFWRRYGGDKTALPFLYVPHAEQRGARAFIFSSKNLHDSGVGYLINVEMICWNTNTWCTARPA